MRRSKVWAFLLLAVAALAAGCADTDAYPNDQSGVEESLTDAGLESVSVTGREDWAVDGWSSEVTVRFATSDPEPTNADLATVRRVVWEQYPHDLEYLTVYVTTPDVSRSFNFTGEQLEGELGAQEYQEEDSEPPLSPGMIAALVIGVVSGLGFITYGVVASRSARRNPPAWAGQPSLPAPAPTPMWPPPRAFTPGPETALPRVETPAAPPIEPPAPLPERGPEPAPEPPPKRPEPAPSYRRNFEETVTALNAGWQWLVDRVPDPPEKDRAAYVDGWLAEHSGVAAKRITAARRTRNNAIHRMHLVTKAQMDEALAVIDKVAEKIHVRPDKD